MGDAEEARRNAAAALALSNGRDVEYAAAFALGFAGDSAQPERSAQSSKSASRRIHSVQFSYVPVLRALDALNRGDPAKALE